MRPAPFEMFENDARNPAAAVGAATGSFCQRSGRPLRRASRAAGRAAVRAVCGAGVDSKPVANRNATRRRHLFHCVPVFRTFSRTVVVSPRTSTRFHQVRHFSRYFISVYDFDDSISPVDILFGRLSIRYRIRVKKNGIPNVTYPLLHRSPPIDNHDNRKWFDDIL